MTGSPQHLPSVSIRVSLASASLLHYGRTGTERDRVFAKPNIFYQKTEEVKNSSRMGVPLPRASSPGPPELLQTSLSLGTPLGTLACCLPLSLDPGLPQGEGCIPP